MANLINLMYSRGITTPLAVSGVVAWYDFSDITTLWKDTGRTSAVTANADIIKGVTDKSGNAVHLSEATNGPTYTTGAQNSNSVARFDGVNDLLTSASITQAQPLTVFIAGKITSVSAATHRFIDANTARCVVGINVSSHAWEMFAGTNVNSTETDADANFHALSVQFNGASSTYRVDGTAKTFGNPSTNSISTTMFLARDNGTAFSALDFGEMVLYNSALSAANQKLVEAYLKAKWGTP